MRTEIVYQKKEYKYSKEIYLAIKEDLKQYAKDQKDLKMQRVSDKNIKVNRTTPQNVAAGKVSSNKLRITCLHYLYNIVREKERFNTFECNEYILKLLSKKYLIQV